MMFKNLRLCFVTSFLLLTTQACAKLPGKKGCEYGEVSVVPSQDLKHALVYGYQICGQGMATSGAVVILLAPSSQLDLEHINDDDWIMVFSGGTDHKQIKATWLNNAEVSITLPPSETVLGPHYPMRIRKSLHGVNIVIASDPRISGASKTSGNFGDKKDQ